MDSVVCDCGHELTEMRTKTILSQLEPLEWPWVGLRMGKNSTFGSQGCPSNCRETGFQQNGVQTRKESMSLTTGLNDKRYCSFNQYLGLILKEQIEWFLNDPIKV